MSCRFSRLRSLSSYPFQLNSERQAGGATPRDPPARRPAVLGDPHRVRSEDIFGGRSMVVIEHGGAVYRLSQTSLGKLILTK